MSISREEYYLDAVTITDSLPQLQKNEYVKDILNGLNQRKKHISSLFFYDEAGSKLFQEITGLPEYYLYHVEKKLLREITPEFCKSLEFVDIVEIGSGDCSKISILLESIPRHWRESVRYIPIDISRAAIEQSAEVLKERFPQIEVHGIVANFINQLHLIPECTDRLFCFLGSTMGNLSEKLARQYLIRIKEVMCAGNTLLLGLDMIKDIEVLERAYNDRGNVTARFNKNVLKVVNRLTGTNFDPDDFQHVAFYNQELSRIEMHLEAKRDLDITSPHLEESIVIKRGERIHTENSHKFSERQIHQMAKKAGLTIKRIFTDEKKWYSLIEMVKEYD
jgi:L-histidine N-alpha-methyltransferase